MGEVLGHAWHPTPEAVWDWGVSWPYDAGSETWSLPRRLRWVGSRAGMRTQQRPASVRDTDTSSLQAAKCWQRPCPGDRSRDSHLSPGSRMSPLWSQSHSQPGPSGISPLLGVGRREGLRLNHLTQRDQVPVSLQAAVSSLLIQRQYLSLCKNRGFPIKLSSAKSIVNVSMKGVILTDIILIEYSSERDP